jgi:hypothetical protein
MNGFLLTDFISPRRRFVSHQRIDGRFVGSGGIGDEKKPA